LVTSIARAARVSWASSGTTEAVMVGCPFFAASGLTLPRAYATPQAGIVNRCADIAVSLKKDAGLIPSSRRR
jgi:hypothetical protein